VPEHFVFALMEAARSAKALGIPSISVIEFGVASGSGLLCLEKTAYVIENEVGINIEVYGFDLESGLPTPKDYRDLPYTWKPGFFKMDRKSLEKKLTKATLVLGDVADTAPKFFDEYKPAPIGFIVFDLDFYSSTKDAFKLLESKNLNNFLPRTYCFFDDIIGDNEEIHCEYVGELLAIREFNEAHEHKKLCKINGLRHKLKGDQAWYDQLYVLHLFNHPLYCQYIREAPDWQLPLSPSASAY